MKPKLLSILLVIAILFIGCNNKEETDEERLRREIAELQEQLKEKEKEIDIKEKKKSDVEDKIEDMTKKKDGENAMYNPEFLISSSKAGKISVGMEVKEIYDLYPSNRIKKSTRSVEGEEYEIYQIYDNSDNLMMEVEAYCTDKCRVLWIGIRSTKMKTNKQIGIGSTIGELRKNHNVEDILEGEGNVVALLKDENITFILDDLRIPNSWWNDQKMNKIPDDIKIVEIFVY
ncbi:MAG: hypothetical protein JW866_04720 [Ignavibacteriales bacterium]|nr:hypothetical protein [Ignavibacteriales bacterium]